MKKLHFRILVFCAILCGVLVQVVNAFGQRRPLMPRQSDKRRVALSPCRLPDIEGEVRCGTYEVFENRETRRGRRIPLKIILLPALSSNPAPDALFILAGGPGQGATDNADFYARIFAPVRRERDIVLIDQRGTGGSNPLDCDLYGGNAQNQLGDLIPIDAIRVCRPQLERRAALRLYTTSIAMDDIDEVRAALGYERINLFGTSYGTRSAQVYMRRYPNHVRSVIMKGVVSLETSLPLSTASASQRSLDLLFDECGRDEACRTAFPNLRQEFQAVLNRFDRGAVRVEVPNPATGRAEQVELSRGAFTTTLRSLLMSIGSFAQVPMLIHRAFENDYAPLVRSVLAIRRSFPKSTSVGMFLSVAAAEDIPLIDRRRIERETDGTFMGDYYLQTVARASEIWARGNLPRGFARPVRSNLPVLLISGFFDAATPPSEGEIVARHLPNSLHVVIRNASHAYGGLSPCVDNLMAAFIANGSVRGLDTACVNQIRRPPFVVTSTGE